MFTINARTAVAAVLSVLMAAGIAAVVLVLFSTTDHSSTDVTLPVGKPTSVAWPVTTPGSVTRVEIVVARITLSDDPGSGSGRKLAALRTFFRNVSSEPVDVRGYPATIGVYSDGGAKAELIQGGTGLCSHVGAPENTVLEANNADPPYLDCQVYRLPAGARGVGRVVFTRNVGGRMTTVTWTPV